MSCMMMQPEAAAALADFLEAVLSMGFNYFGFEAPQSLVDASRDCNDSNFYPYFNAGKIYRKLCALNAAAYNGRYGKPDDADPQAPEVDIPSFSFYKPSQYSSQHFVVQSWHYKALKLLDFWIYQTCETATEKDPFRQGLKDLRDTLTGFIARNCDDYQTFPWGSL